jgi:hypothetical protein
MGRICKSVIWSGDRTGRNNCWLDGEKIIGHQGPTIAIADKVAFKFEAYRFNLNRHKNPNDFEVFYLKVGTANKCEKLKSIHCSKIKKSLEVVGYQNLQVERHEAKSETDFLKCGRSKF